MEIKEERKIDSQSHYRMLSKELLCWYKRSIIGSLLLRFWFIWWRWLLFSRRLRRKWWCRRLRGTNGIDHGWHVWWRGHTK